ncbi:hypothetical protein A6R68_17926, partial [Neotoma lepida]
MVVAPKISSADLAGVALAQAEDEWPRKCRRFEIDQEPKSSRHCTGVIGYPLLRKETQADPSMAGLKISTGGWEDYDVTEWAGSQHVGIFWIPTGFCTTAQLALGYQVPVGRGPPPRPLLLTCRVFLSWIFQPDVQWELLCSYSLQPQGHCDSQARQDSALGRSQMETVE